MQNIEVEITLKTGQSATCVLPSNSELLHDLYVSLAAAEQHPQPSNTILQIPIDEGKAAFTFMSGSLASVITRPPVLIEPQNTQPIAGAAQSAGGAPAHVRIDDFLTPAENSELLTYALDNEEHFEGSTVITDSKKQTDNSVRKSRVLFSVKEAKWRSVFINRIKLHLPHIASALGENNFSFDDNEIQLTASNDGDFFRPHNDADRNDADVAQRVITFVYYFHKLPKPYVGGDLLLYNPNAGDPVQQRSGNVTAIAPENNCLVAFSSHLLHEVDLVQCPGGSFADSRFTINGWLRRGNQ